MKEHDLQLTKIDVIYVEPQAEEEGRVTTTAEATGSAVARRLIHWGNKETTAFLTAIVTDIMPDFELPTAR